MDFLSVTQHQKSWHLGPSKRAGDNPKLMRRHLSQRLALSYSFQQLWVCFFSFENILLVQLFILLFSTNVIHSNSSGTFRWWRKLNSFIWVVSNSTFTIINSELSLKQHNVHFHTKTAWSWSHFRTIYFSWSFSNVLQVLNSGENVKKTSLEIFSFARENLTMGHISYQNVSFFSLKQNDVVAKTLHYIVFCKKTMVFICINAVCLCTSCISILRAWAGLEPKFF